MIRYIIFYCILWSINAQEIIDKCVSKESCSLCIQQIECAWCIKLKDDTNSRNQSNCQSIQNIKAFCKLEHIVNPESYVKIIEEKSESRFQPQHIEISLRKHESKIIQFQYIQRNYPVDLYYLIDGSKGASAHRQKLGKLGNKLTQEMSNITKNFKIGYGTFVDKVDLPFTTTAPDMLESLCQIGDTRCVRPYSFKNHLNLTENLKDFSRKVAETKYSVSMDNPEGQLDALMQVIVCKKIIGWRSEARHIIVLSTDADFHIAGDGKLGGIIERNDAKCHLIDNEYKENLKYDYPSVSQLNYVAKKNDIFLIFAFIRSSASSYMLVNSYRKLTKEIKNSYFYVLNQKKTDIMELLLKYYKKIANSVIFESFSPNNVNVKISTLNCKSSIENECSNIKIGDKIKFDVTITASSCDGTENPAPIVIKPKGIKASLKINVKILCNCQCENSQDKHFEMNSVKCNSVGNLTCGICTCPKNKLGTKCDCDNTSDINTLDESNCLNEKNEICSGQGVCKCGKCNCFSRTNRNEIIYGKFCESDNFSCNRENGIICSGHGTCDSGSCICNSDWSGKACECPNTITTCKSSGNIEEKIYSGQGSCICGKCKCVDGYTGTFCESCPTCKDRCDKIKDCVECKTYNQGIYSKEMCEKKCSNYVINKINNINDLNEANRTKMCRIFDKDSCYFFFSYTYNENKELIITAEEMKKCSFMLVFWTSTIILTILLGGIVMLIIWKVVTEIQDHRQYKNSKKRSYYLNGVESQILCMYVP